MQVQTKAGVKIGTGWSSNPNSYEAGIDAAKMALQGLGQEAPVCAMVYSTVLHDQPKVLAGIRSVLPGVTLVGCSTQGISRNGSVDEVQRIVGMALFGSASIKCRAACVQSLSQDPKKAGAELARQLGQPNPKIPLFLWYDPLRGANVQELIDQLHAAGFTSIFGGAAGQPWDIPFSKTFQYFNENVTSDAAVALQLEGPIEILSEISHGVEPLGVDLKVTGANKNIISSLENRPALDIWAEQLGGANAYDSNAIACWALGVKLPPDLAKQYEGPVSRAVFGFDQTNKAIVVQVPIPEGSTVSLCHRTPQAIVDRALAMAKRMQKRLVGKKALVALSFECGARPRPFLGDDKALEEVLVMQEIIGKDIPWLGGYLFGELAPIGNKTFFHNYTFPLCVICQAA